MSKRHVPTLIAFAFAASCGAHAPAPKLYRYADLAKRPETTRTPLETPLILEFQPGDRLPVDLTFTDQHLALEPQAPPLALVVKEHCYVRVDEQGFRMSRDLQGFDRDEKAPGSFAVGFDRNEHGPILRVLVQTPRR